MSNYDYTTGKLKTLDFADPKKWYEYMQTLYPLNKYGKRKLVRIVVGDITPEKLQRIVNSGYNKNTVFEITNYVFLNSENNDLSDQSVFSRCNLDKLIFCVSILNEHGYNNIVFQDGMSIERVIDANEELFEWADSINKATFDSSPLSPLEKYLLAYKYVTKYIYHDTDIYVASRRVSHILNNDGENIVCLGYAALLTELCKKVGIPCVIQYLNDIENNEPRHANAMVYVKDEKYNVNGVYISDPCFDSKQPNRASKHLHGMLKLDDAERVYKNLNMELVNPEETFGILSSIPQYILDTETGLSKSEREEVGDIIITQKNYHLLTTSPYDIEKVMEADMVANFIIHPDYSNKQIAHLIISDFTDDNGKLPY